jgi:MFS family permease
MPDSPSAAFDSPRAWFVCFGAFIGAFVAFGVTYTFGVFLKPMAATFGASHAAMSALFSCLTVLSFFLAVYTGDLADRKGPRPVVAAGALLMGAGLLGTSRVSYFPLLFLTYGIGIGAAVACIYVPAISAVGEWFKAHRDIALGISISGIGCGTLVAAPLAAMLTNRFGWRTAFEIFSVISTALLLLSAALLTRPPIPREKAKSDVMEKVRTRQFVLLYISLLFAGIAVYISFVFLPAYAGDIGASRVAGATLIAYIGASSVVGRLGLNALAPRFGLLNMYKVSFLCLLGSYGFWLTAHSYGSLVVFGLIMGVGYGGIAAMAPAVAASTFGVEGLGELLGIFFTGFGVACLVGPTAAGVLVDHTGDYKWPVFVAAASSVAALAVILMLQRGPALAVTRQDSAAAD